MTRECAERTDRAVEGPVQQAEGILLAAALDWEMATQVAAAKEWLEAEQQAEAKDLMDAAR